MDGAVAEASIEEAIGDRDRLVSVLAQLGAEIASEAPASEPRTQDLKPEQSPSALARLTTEDEQLVASIRSGLTDLAYSPLTESCDSYRSLSIALDGVEYVVRDTILTGRGERLAEILPSCVFLVLLPTLGRPEALRIADRSASLLAA